LHSQTAGMNIRDGGEGDARKKNYTAAMGGCDPASKKKKAVEKEKESLNKERFGYGGGKEKGKCSNKTSVPNKNGGKGSNARAGLRKIDQL